MEGNYKHRVVDALLERKLLGKGAVLVEGAKWCGKTTTSSRLANGCTSAMSELAAFGLHSTCLTLKVSRPFVLGEGNQK